MSNRLHSTESTTLAPTAPLRVTSLSLRQLLDISPDALVVVDQTGTIAMANGQAAALFGYGPEELQGQRLEVLLPEHARLAHAEHLEHYFSAPGTRPMGVGLQLLGQRKDGAQFPLDISLRPLLLDEELLAIGAIRDVSQQRHAERERAEHLQQIRLQAKLINLEHDAILVCDPDPLRRVLSWNRGAEELYGWTAQEAIGQVTHTLLQTRFPQPLETLLDCLEQKGQWEGELTQTSLDGRQILVESHWVLMRDERGRPLALLEINRDITERRALQQRLQEAERRASQRADQLEAIFEALPEALMTYDREGRITGMNAAGRAFFERLGLADYALAPWGKRTAHATVWDEQGQPLARESFPIARILAGEVLPPAQAMEIVVRDQQGELVFLSVTGGPLLDAQGQPLSAVTVSRDITARKRTERALQQQTQQLQEQVELINLAHDAILVRDLHGRILSWNRGAEHLYGWTAQGVLGRVTHELLQTCFPVSLAEVEAQLEREGQWEGELGHCCRDGSRVMVESRQVLKRDADGQPIAILEINRDITERQELERQKDLLLSMVSHELQAPILNAKFALDVLEEEVSQKGDEDLTSWLGKIVTQLDDLQCLIDAIVDATTLAGRILPLHPTQFSLDKLVRELVMELANTQPTRQLLMEGEAASQVYADRGRTRQILSNLLSNALKYSAQGQPVHVRTAVEEDRVTVSVQDHGVGIPKHELARIFDRLVRLGGQQQAGAPGLGLGLYIAAELVKRQGGRLWVESTPGKGSTFSFTLPRQRPQGPSKRTSRRGAEHASSSEVQRTD